MAFGISRLELAAWKKSVLRGDIAFLTHYWFDPRFPDSKTVTKVGCADLNRLADWCSKHGLDANYIHHHPRFPHFDLLGSRQREILLDENLGSHIERFGL